MMMMRCTLSLAKDLKRFLTRLDKTDEQLTTLTFGKELRLVKGTSELTGHTPHQIAALLTKNLIIKSN